MTANKYASVKETGKKIAIIFGCLLIAGSPLFAQQAVANTVKKKAAVQVIISTSTQSTSAKTVKKVTTKQPVSQMVSPTKNTQNQTTIVQNPKVQNPKMQSEKSEKLRKVVKEVIKEELNTATGMSKETESETKKEKKPTYVVVLELIAKTVTGLGGLAATIFGILKYLKKRKDDKEAKEKAEKEKGGSKQPDPVDISFTPLVEKINALKENMTPHIDEEGAEIWVRKMLNDLETQRRTLKSSIDEKEEEMKKICKDLREETTKIYTQKREYFLWEARKMSKTKSNIDEGKIEGLVKAKENLQESLKTLGQMEGDNSQYLKKVFSTISRHASIIIVKKNEIEKKLDELDDIKDTEIKMYLETVEKTPGVEIKIVSDKIKEFIQNCKNEKTKLRREEEEIVNNEVNSLRNEILVFIKRYYPHTLAITLQSRKV